MTEQIILGRRTESPSSVKTFKQCPRKYYYNYIEELPTRPSIHLVRGKMVHSVLENFYDQNTEDLSWETMEPQLLMTAQQLLIKEWKNNNIELARLRLTEEETVQYFEETLHMIVNWTIQKSHELQKYKDSGTVQEVFKTFTPRREQEYKSEKHGVRGFIDMIEETPQGVKIMDYKTNKSQDIEDHRLQLAIYALLYKEKHGKLPDKTGIYFLRGTPEHLEVNEELVQYAIRNLKEIHSKTKSNNYTDYPKQLSKLCNYCDYNEMCFKGKSVEQYKKDFKEKFDIVMKEEI
ncbi:PD-(D/E)XK nuclease family protein [Candidatus Woesearchaeota archaeon]|nr:PD-(D/E)XK nuclease family protein [Candidatus Woesearchaeota archaeon]